MNSLMKVLAFTAMLMLILLITVHTVSALSCSYTYVSKGGSIYLTPSLSMDTEYYRWSIDRVDDSADRGVTSWIYKNYTFTQIFALEYAAEYHITLQAKDTSGTIMEYSRFMYTTRSSLSVQEEHDAIIEDNESIGRENIVDGMISFFASLPLLEKIFAGIIISALSVFLCDVALGISTKRKGVLHKITHRR